MKSYKGLGLVNEVFKESKLEELSGNIGIGHVRYSTTGSTTVENAQPLVLNYLKGSLSLSHNGNLVNAMELREQMENTGAIFHTSIDSEIIAYGIARERVHSKTVEEAILRTVKEIRGAYALVIMSPRKLIGVRDPYGLKPLCIGKRDNAWVLASESCALTSIGAEFVRDVAPGEIVTFDKTGNLKSEFMPVDVKKAHCIFEYIYFARLDSKIDNISVYEAESAAVQLSQRPTRLTQTSSVVSRTPDLPPQRAIPKNPASRSVLRSTKTAMSAVPSSSRPRRNGNPASKSS